MEQVDFLATLKSNGINAVFHYVPLHDSVAGKRFGRTGSAMSVTEDVPGRLVRLPLFPSLTEADVTTVLQKTRAELERNTLERSQQNTHF